MEILIRLLFWAVFNCIITTKKITIVDWQFWVLVISISIFAHII